MLHPIVVFRNQTLVLDSSTSFYLLVLNSKVTVDRTAAVALPIDHKHVQSVVVSRKADR